MEPVWVRAAGSDSVCLRLSLGDLLGQSKWEARGGYHLGTGANEAPGRPPQTEGCAGGMRGHRVRSGEGGEGHGLRQGGEEGPRPGPRQLRAQPAELRQQLPAVGQRRRLRGQGGG